MRRWMRGVGMVFLGVGAAAMAGCKGEEPGGFSCNYDFVADVRGGPNAGLHLEGGLALTDDGTGALTGTLRPLLEDGTQGDAVEVTGTGDAGAETITLDIALTTPGPVVATGALNGAAPETCGGEMAGDLSGPDAADRGEWSALALGI